MNFHETRLLEALNAEGVQYLIVGSHAKRYHGLAVTPNDLDVYVGSEQTNLVALLRALDIVDPIPGRRTLGQGSFRYKQIGVTLGAGHADVLTDVKGIDFEAAWASRQTITTGKLETAVLSRATLLAHLQASERAKDQAHAAELAKTA